MLNSKRTNVNNIIPLEDTKKTLKRAIGAWQERSKITDKVGRGMYVIAAYEKIKRITIPLDNSNLLFISLDNTPLKASKGEKLRPFSRDGQNHVNCRFCKCKPISNFFRKDACALQIHAD